MTLGAAIVELQVRIELKAENQAALRAGLVAAIAALDQGIEPNTLWGDGWYLGIVPGGPL